MPRITCPKCGNVSDFEVAGATGGVSCPYCGAAIQMPAGAPPTPAFPRPPAPPRISRPPSSGLATASLVLGIISFICVGPLASLPGLICGIIALNQIRKSSGQVGGEGLAVGGLITSGINLAVCVLIIPMFAAISLPALARAREAARRASCQNNLKQMGIVFKMFANESKEEYYPVLAAEPGKLMFANTNSSYPGPVYPEYLTDLSVLLCPSDEESGTLSSQTKNPEVMIDDHSYFYLGYAVANDDDMDKFADAYRKHTVEKEAEAVGGSVPRLQEGVEKRINASQAEIPIMIERLDNHIPTGANVLFMDGHVEYIRYPGKWPLTEHMVAILQALDGNYWPPRAVNK